MAAVLAAWRQFIREGRGDHVTTRLLDVLVPIATTRGVFGEHDVTYENRRYFDARVQPPGWLNCKRMLVSLILSLEILCVRYSHIRVRELKVRIDTVGKISKLFDTGKNSNHAVVKSS